MKILAKTLHGLEEVLVEELKKIGASKIFPSKRAVSFEGDQKLLYRANLEVRTALSFLVPIYTFSAKDEQELYDKVKAFDWSKYMSLKDTFAIYGTTFSETFTHSKYIALKTKDAIVDQFREQTGRRPNVNRISPTLRIHIHINKNFCTISLDSSGDPLFKRGYRVDTLEAPINEILAAGMILLSGWRGECDFIDPMCGSGTLPIEAALIAKNIAPNIFRKGFGFQNWRDYDADLWEEVLTEAKAKERDLTCNITGYDREFKAVRIAEHNAQQADLEGVISFKRKKFERLEPMRGEHCLMMNPPYDVRMQMDSIEDFYKMIGDRLKQVWSGSRAWIISSNEEAFKHIGLRPSRKIALQNGALKCQFQEFEMYGGSRKKNNSDKFKTSTK